MKKGQTNNPNGRGKGTPNKVTTELRQWVSEWIDDNREQFKLDMMTVEPEKRLAMFEKMIQYVLPKQQQIVEEATDDRLETMRRYFSKE